MNSIKRILTLFIILVLLIPFIFGLCVKASSSDEWKISADDSSNLIAILDYDTKTLTIRGTGKMKDWKINGPYPDWYNSGYKENIENIIIEEGVTNIGNLAFDGCYKVTEITIPNTVTSIGKYAFSSCSKLESITIPSSVTSIESSAFNYCSNLKKIYCEKNSYAEQYAKDHKLGYNNGESVTTVWDITKVGEENVYAILDYHARNLTITGEGEMKDYTINSLPEWYNQIYKENIDTIIIEEGVTNIGDLAFEGCNEATKVIIPDTVTSIGRYAFSYCTELINIEIPSSVTNIGLGTFDHCSKLATIDVNSENENYENQNGALVDKANCKIIKYPEGITQSEYTISDNIQSIGYNAFMECANLSSITIPKSVTDITQGAFSNCNEDLVINCYRDSVAHTYAIENDINYQLIYEEVAPTSIELNKTEITLDIADNSDIKTEQLIATITPDYANVQNEITWDSDDLDVATVDENGNVTAVGKGECTITVETENGKKATCRVTVVDNSEPDTEEINPERVKLDKSSVELDLNGTKEVKLNATIEPSDANINTGLTWTSEDDTIATVDKTGKITAKKTGTCTITVKTANGKTATCQVTVINSMNNQNNSGNGNGQNNSGSGSGSSNGGNVGSSGSTQKNNSGKTTENISNTLSSTVLPKTGYQVGLLIGIITLVVVAIVCYKKSKIY